MIRLALICSPQFAQSYQQLGGRLRNASLTACAPSVPITGQSEFDFTASSLAQLLEQHRGDFDAVVLHGTSVSTPDQAEAVAAAGKHLLASGPIAGSPQQASTLLELFEKDSTRLMVAKPWRHSPSIQSIKKSLTTGKLGIPGLLRIHDWKSSNSDTRPLIDRILPALDVAHWIFENQPTRIFALSQPKGHSRPDYLQLHLGFPNDGMALIDYTWCLPGGGGYESTSVIGSTGAAYADDHHNMNLLFDGGSPSAIKTGISDAYLIAQLQEFVDALGTPSPPCIVGDNGMASLQIAEAAIAAVTQSRLVNLTHDQYEPS